MDWLCYRNKNGLPITIVQGEQRSAVWMEELVHRLLAMAKSSLTGIRHIPATRIVSRVELAKFLMKKLEIKPQYQVVDRHQLNHPHLGSIELMTDFNDELSRPLRSVLDSPK